MPKQEKYRGVVPASNILGATIVRYMEKEINGGVSISNEKFFNIYVANYYIIWGISPMSQNMGGTLPEYTQSYHTESI